MIHWIQYGRMVTTRQGLASWIRFSAAMNAWFVYCDSCYGLTACTRCSQDQLDGSYSMGYRDLWQRKQTSSSGSALGLGLFTAMHKSMTPCYNYYTYLKLRVVFPSTFCRWVHCTHTPVLGAIVQYACIGLWIYIILFEHQVDLNLVANCNNV